LKVRQRNFYFSARAAGWFLCPASLGCLQRVIGVERAGRCCEATTGWLIGVSRLLEPEGL
jgi:hypothetical protein